MTEPAPISKTPLEPPNETARGGDDLDSGGELSSESTGEPSLAADPNQPMNQEDMARALMTLQDVAYQAFKAVGYQRPQDLASRWASLLAYVVEKDMLERMSAAQNLAGMVYTIAWRKALKARKREAALKRGGGLVRQDSSNLPHADVQQRPAADEASLREAAEVVLAELERHCAELDPQGRDRYREISRLRVFGDADSPMTFPEISARTGIPLTTVFRRWEKVAKRLEGRLSQILEDLRS